MHPRLPSISANGHLHVNDQLWDRSDHPAVALVRILPKWNGNFISVLILAWLSGKFLLKVHKLRKGEEFVWCFAWRYTQKDFSLLSLGYGLKLHPCPFTGFQCLFSWNKHQLSETGACSIFFIESLFRKHKAYDMYVHSSGDFSTRLDYFCSKTQ